MNVVLAFPLMLAILSRGRGSLAATTEACFQLCQPGYHKSGECSDASGGAAKLKCERCDTNTFTDIANSSPTCERCQSCAFNQDVIKPCTFSSNVQCDCRSGYYNQSPSGNEKFCRSCKTQPGRGRKDTPDYHDYIRKCKPCESSTCVKDPECRRKYGCEVTASVRSAPATSTAALAAFSGVMATKRWAPTVEPVPVNGGLAWLVWLVVTLAVLSGLLLLRRLFGAPHGCLYWRTQKAVTQRTDEPRLNEQHGHRDDASTTLTINTCEETPKMSLSQSPSTSEHPGAACILLPSTEVRAAKQDEQPTDWPAIVLYAIIKEVPLRRWKEFLRLLSVADEQLERVEMEAGPGLGSMERQYQMLRLWSQRPSASLVDVFSALHYMDLSRCAELLEENLESLQWRTAAKRGDTA